MAIRGKLFCRAGHYFLVFIIFLKKLGGGTRLAMPKTICAPDSSSLKPGSGATEGVLGVRLAGLYLQPDSRTMKIQDRRLRPVSGRFFPWRGRQARRADIQDLLPM